MKGTTANVNILDLDHYVYFFFDNIHLTNTRYIFTDTQIENADFI